MARPKSKGLPLVEAAVDLARERFHIDIELFVMRGQTAPEEVPTILNAADCLVFASAFEGSPNIVKEAIACNLPVVTVDVGDVAERLKGVEPSRIVPHDPTAFAQALSEILLLRKRSNGSETVKEISEAQIARKLIALYNAISLARS